MDDHGVGIGNIQSCLNDGSGDQHVDLTVDEAVHDLFKLMFMHLAMGKCHVCLRYQLCHAVGDLIYIVDPVIDVIDLTAPGNFPADRLTYHLLIIFHDIGLNRGSVHGSLFQNAHVTDPYKTHVKSSWNGSGCQGEHIHILLQALDLLLMCHTEALLLIHYEESKILVFYIL